jgi:ABC-type Fe2+-enterobactin transport system substrate-binding protein
MQASAEIPLPFPATEPHCVVWYSGDPCDQLIQQYHQVTAQRQQQEWQNTVTTRFEKQAADQQKQIATQKAQIAALQLKIDSQTMEALRSEARAQSILDGIGVVIGMGLAFLMVIAFFRKLSRHAPAAPPERSRAASA